MEKGKGVMGAGRRWAVDFSDNSTAPSSRDILDPPGFTRASVDQLNTLGLLPTHASDWVSSLSPAQVFEVAPSLFMADVRKASGDTLEYHKFYKNFCNKLDNIMWKPTEDIANPSVLRSLTCRPFSIRSAEGSYSLLKLHQ